MSEIDIKTEEEGDRHWRYTVELFHEGRHQTHQVTLSWSDYDLWTHGRVPPERVIEAAFEFLLEREPASAIMSEFDCSVLRRYFPEVDDRLPTLL
ncbi:MAG: hypothetical protein R3336_08545 [Phycisphaeraceae bacterium]|nr:hypothetical protein [Phycisphaeraceae bacterium]